MLTQGDTIVTTRMFLVEILKKLSPYHLSKKSHSHYFSLNATGNTVVNGFMSLMSHFTNPRMRLVGQMKILLRVRKMFIRVNIISRVFFFVFSHFSQ